MKEFKERIVEDVVNDFIKRREERLPLEKQWELNLKFLEGKQYYSLLSNGSIIEKERNRRNRRRCLLRRADWWRSPCRWC